MRANYGPALRSSFSLRGLFIWPGQVPHALPRPDALPYLAAMAAGQHEHLRTELSGEVDESDEREHMRSDTDVAWAGE